jgi:hypothetical protein
MGSRKVNTEGIDEELLLASIGRRTQDGTLRPAQEVPAAAPTEEDTAAPEPSPVQPVTREKAQRESGRRKRQDEDYNELFLRRNEIKTRQCVYISRDVHGKILRIVNDIAGGDTTHLSRRICGYRAAPASGTAQGENQRTVQETT